MGQQNETRYDNRTVDEWVKRARDGRVAVADFQRSFVWPAKKAGRYINAILRGRPVGFYLILDAAPSQQFSPRRFSNMETPLDKVEELVLDGQQRLTSLLHALYGHPSSRFFIEVEDLAAETLELKRVVAYGNSNPKAKRLAEPVEAYRSHHIPLDVLRRPEGNGAKSNPLTKWCSEVGPEVTGFENYAEFAEFQGRIVRGRPLGRTIGHVRLDPDHRLWIGLHAAPDVPGQDIPGRVVRVLAGCRRGNPGKLAHILCLLRDPRLIPGRWPSKAA